MQFYRKFDLKELALELAITDPENRKCGLIWKLKNNFKRVSLNHNMVFRIRYSSVFLELDLSIFEQLHLHEDEPRTLPIYSFGLGI